MAELAPIAKPQFFDANGDPLAGGKLYTYEAGTSTPKATYTDRSESTQNTNPIILDANGRCNLWIGSGYYKFVMKDSTDVELWTQDQVSLPSEAALASAFWRGVIHITDADSPYTLDQDHNGYLINADTTSGSITINLPEISSVVLPYNVGIKKRVAANTITINRAGTDTIDNTTSKTLETIDAGIQFIADIDKAPDDWSSLALGTVADGAVTTAKLASDSVTLAKVAVGALDSTVATKTADYTILTTEKTSVFDCSASGGNITITLPSAAAVPGRRFRFRRSDQTLANRVTIARAGSDTIRSSATSYKLCTQNECIDLISDGGTNWILLHQYIPSLITNAGAMTITGVTVNPTKGTTVVDKVSWYREKNFANLIYQYEHNGGAPAAGTGDYLFALPSGLTIDTNVYPANTTTSASLVDRGIPDSVVPSNTFINAAGTTRGMGLCVVYSTTQFRVGTWVDATTFTVWGSGSMTLGNSQVGFGFNLKVPIADWEY